MTTNTTTLADVFKSRQNFLDYIEANSSEVISQLLENYPKRSMHIVYPQLTQSSEGLINAAGELVDEQKAYIFWFIANEKEDLLKIAKTLNNFFDKNYCGIFVIKAFLNVDKIEFNCILKPEHSINKNTPCKIMQKQYWERYFESRDEMALELQVNPQYQHGQYLPMHKRRVCLMLSVSIQKEYIGVDLVISDKTIYKYLYNIKDKIEAELGKLEWINEPNNKTTKIRKTLTSDVSDLNTQAKAVKDHIDLALQFKEIFSKYLN